MTSILTIGDCDISKPGTNIFSIYRYKLYFVHVVREYLTGLNTVLSITDLPPSIDGMIRSCIGTNDPPTEDIESGVRNEP